MQRRNELLHIAPPLPLLKRPAAMRTVHLIDRNAGIADRTKSQGLCHWVSLLHAVSPALWTRERKKNGENRECADDLRDRADPLREKSTIRDWLVDGGRCRMPARSSSLQ